MDESLKLMMTSTHSPFARASKLSRGCSYRRSWARTRSRRALLGTVSILILSPQRTQRHRGKQSHSPQRSRRITKGRSRRADLEGQIKKHRSRTADLEVYFLRGTSCPLWLIVWFVFSSVS